jgi:hypothetical protein
MGRVLPVVIIALLTIYCLVEVAQADPGRVRLAPRWLWAAAVIVLPLVGPRSDDRSSGVPAAEADGRRWPPTTTPTSCGGSES